MFSTKTHLRNDHVSRVCGYTHSLSTDWLLHDQLADIALIA